MLLDNASPDATPATPAADPATPPADANPATPEPAADPAPATPADANPEIIYADKFNSVGDLETGYKELQSMMSKKLGAFEGAPEAYELEEGIELGDKEGLYGMLSEWGAENQLSNEGMNKLVSKYAEFEDAARTEKINAEFEKLGADADHRTKNVRDFLTANLGDETTKALAEGMTSAASIEAIEKLIEMTKSPVAAAAPAQALSKEKVHAMRFAENEHGQRLMSVDPEYRAKVLAAEESLL